MVSSASRERRLAVAGSRIALASALVLAAFTGSSWAQQCKSSGDLRYIGNSNNGTRSVWLSTTIESGGYRLEAAQGNTTVDSWSREEPGRRLSLSPFVSNGSGGTHRLFGVGTAPSGGDCLIDTQNQKHGLILPPLPPHLVRPQAPIAPPIAVLPPTGVMPTFPPGGVRPPTGVMPTFPPGGVRPPTGAMPTFPPGGVRPPTGAMPTFPPGGVRPPTGAMPTFPPGGVRPPTGAMPSFPATVTPPVGVLPPSGVTPERPEPPKHPTGVVPPAGAQPGQMAANSVAPGGTVPDPGHADGGCSQVSGGKFDPAPCDPDVVGDLQNPVYSVPVTPGRDFAPPSPWNVWTDLRFSSVRNNSSGRNAELDDVFFAVGVDRLISSGLVLGLQFEVDRANGSSFGGAVTQDSNSFAVGPYFGLLLSDNWTLNGALTFGYIETDLSILTLSGDYSQTRNRANLSLTGQYVFDRTIVRPRLRLDYTHYSGADYQLDGPVGGTALVVDASMPSNTVGTFSPQVEFSQVIYGQNALYVPFLELGAVYAFEPGGGGLSSASGGGSDWTGTVRAGLRMRAHRGLYLEASVGYLSLFQDDLESLDAGLFLAHSF